MKLEREHSKPRRNMHPVLKQGNAQFRALQRQRAQRAGADGQEAAQQGGQQQRRRRQGRQQGRPQEAAADSST